MTSLHHNFLVPQSQSYPQFSPKPASSLKWLISVSVHPSVHPQHSKVWVRYISMYMIWIWDAVAVHSDLMSLDLALLPVAPVATGQGWIFMKIRVVWPKAKPDWCCNIMVEGGCFSLPWYLICVLCGRAHGGSSTLTLMRSAAGCRRCIKGPWLWGTRAELKSDVVNVHGWGSKHLVLYGCSRIWDLKSYIHIYNSYYMIQNKVFPQFSWYYAVDGCIQLI